MVRLGSYSLHPMKLQPFPFWMKLQCSYFLKFSSLNFLLNLIIDANQVDINLDPQGFFDIGTKWYCRHVTRYSKRQIYPHFSKMRTIRERKHPIMYRGKPVKDVHLLS